MKRKVLVSGGVQSNLILMLYNLKSIESIYLIYGAYNIAPSCSVLESGGDEDGDHRLTWMEESKLTTAFSRMLMLYISQHVQSMSMSLSIHNNVLIYLIIII